MANNSTNHYRIADLYVRIIFQDTAVDNINLLSSFEPFRISDAAEDLFFQLIVNDSLTEVPEERRKRIRAFETGNGDTIVDRLDHGGYQYIVKNLDEDICCLLQTNKDFSDCVCTLRGDYNMRCFGLLNALMMIFSFAGSLRETLLIHASLVRQNGYGYAFNARSGTGKSTHVSLWLRYLPGCDLMNDDNPIIRIIDGIPYIYGSPWSGKTPCYRNVKARLGAITRIDRAPTNHIERLSPVEAFTSLLPSCSSMKWDSVIFNKACDTITRIIETTGIYTLHCLPNKEAALLCNKTISR